MYESISLFSGAMGLDLGLEKAGINIKLCQDFDESCYQTMLINGKPAMSGKGWTLKRRTIPALWRATVSTVLYCWKEAWDKRPQRFVIHGLCQNG